MLMGTAGEAAPGIPSFPTSILDCCPCWGSRWADLRAKGEGPGNVYRNRRWCRARPTVRLVKSIVPRVPQPAPGLLVCICFILRLLTLTCHSLTAGSLTGRGAQPPFAIYMSEPCGMIAPECSEAPRPSERWGQG